MFDLIELMKNKDKISFVKWINNFNIVENEKHITKYFNNLQHNDINFFQ